MRFFGGGGGGHIKDRVYSSDEPFNLEYLKKNTTREKWYTDLSIKNYIEKLCKTGPSLSVSSRGQFEQFL